MGRAKHESYTSRTTLSLRDALPIGRGAYAGAAVALARTGEADDQALSDEIAGCLAAMPPAVARRLALALEMMQGRQATEPARELEGGAGPGIGRAPV